MKKLAVDFDEESLKKLTTLANLSEVKASSIVKQSIINQKYIKEKQSLGAVFFVLEANGDTREVVFR
jgi:hypothetical protein